MHKTHGVKIFKSSRVQIFAVSYFGCGSRKFPTIRYFKISLIFRSHEKRKGGLIATVCAGAIYYGISYINLLTFFVTLTSASQSISLVKDSCHQPCPVGMMMRRISSTLSCLSNTLHLFLWNLLIAWNELIQTISDITGGQRSARTPPSLLITGSASPC